MVCYLEEPKSAVATIEPLAGSRVPVGVFEISDWDEKYLDRYEDIHIFIIKIKSILKYVEKRRRL